ncbi:hypothetical protein [Candidatus Allofournierella excrementigallinarum]|uniref:hypothetical protein n=1 Tax=Candidatus Allofournierella excrementigallinarum TaxID=2838592 RepID=UPI00374FB689
MDYREEFVKLFTDDPVNWAKWAAVFAVLIFSYCFSIPLFNKVSYRLGREYKRDLARKRGHIIKAFILDQHPSGDAGKYDWYAKYEYSLDEKGVPRLFSLSQPPASGDLSLLRQQPKTAVFNGRIPLGCSAGIDQIAGLLPSLDSGGYYNDRIADPAHGLIS